MAGTKIENVLLTAGQNEGIERAVLPAPQLSSVLNMRLRKGSRWGKRFGHTALSLTNLSSTAGFPRSVGGGKGSSNTCFALVDDRCSVYDQTAAAFVDPVSVTTQAPIFRVAAAASGWLPDTSFFPVPAQSPNNQTTTPCAGAYAFGYLWTAIQYTEIGSTDKKLRVVATDPNDQTVVRVDDFSATTAGFGGNVYPRLILVGATLVLTYVLTTAVGLTSIKGRSTTGIGVAWGAETALAPAITTSYDVSVYSPTRFILGLASLFSSVNLFNTALGLVTSVAIADPSGNPLTEINVTGTSTVAAGEIYVGYACAATPSSKVAVFTANLAGAVGTATLSAIAKRPLLALLPGGGVRAVYNEAVGGTFGSFNIRDVSAAAVVGANALTQSCAYPISIPFTIGSTVYVWAKTEVSSASYATLLRLPPPASFATGSISCPIEMSSQDYTVSAGAGLIETDARGLPVVTQLGATAAYTVPVPTLYALPSAIATGHDFRILQAKHYTDAANRRSVQAIYADSSAFLPMGALTRVDDRGVTESGFIHSPTIFSLTPAVGAGALTPLTDYYYTAVYRSRNSNGRTEVSAPSAPIKVSMGAGQNQNTVTLMSLGLSARSNVSIEIYRTLSNGQTFFLAAVIDSSTASIGYLDQLADTTVAVQQALYTQVGQTLANSFPPPSRFGCAGGQRLFLGGLIRPDIVQASKLIFGDQSPSFADNDAFRIVLPAACTGVAWMDTLCLFTSEGIYIASGDGPDDAGVGDFGTLTRMPYELGCIEPRSVVVVDDGCFFQTARGLYLLPRGFGAPVPAGDNVQDTLAGQVITGCSVLTKTTEQSVHWTAGVSRIIYDLAHKSWSVDSLQWAGYGTGQWASNEVAVFGDLLASLHGFIVTNSGFDDMGSTFSVVATTGDLRPFGVLSEGSVCKVQLLSELRSACTLNVGTITDFGTNGADRIFALVAGDTQIGQLTVTDVELGHDGAREINSVRVQLIETSATEGIAFIALALEHEQGEGLKRASQLSRVT